MHVHLCPPKKGRRDGPEEIHKKAEVRVRVEENLKPILPWEVDREEYRLSALPFRMSDFGKLYLKIEVPQSDIGKPKSNHIILNDFTR
jgi:hypothetical protein